MIFVTIGMHTHGFDRLLRKMDEIASAIDEEIIMQIGSAEYIPRDAQYFKFVTEQEFRQLCGKARVVVTHGAMSIVDALEQGTPVIAVPRLKEYGEAIDDHQSHLVRELEREGKVIAVWDVERLEETLKRGSSKSAKLVRDGRLSEAVKRYVAQFEQS